MTFWAIVVAAGSGSRFGGPKHEVRLAGRPLWEIGRTTLAAAGAAAVVVVGDVDGGIAGGARRRDSVAAGLAAVPVEAQFVLVHDAARPLASVELARAVASRIMVGDVDAVVPALEVTDAVKQVDADGKVTSVDRSDLRVAQTPQGFRTASLKAAHDSVTGDAADDAELIERWGGTVTLVAGEAANFKITYQSDVAAAAALLESP